MTDFDKAAEAVKQLKDVKQDDLLIIYGLFKQANNGDCTGSRPGMLDPKGQAKYDAWKKNEGMSQDDAKEKYVAKAKELGASF
eukprot:CAMPEP_0171478774 /NCGR_PEP_ID=MMETSP0946-20130122/4973_1 /TAXON_ID=109269 /ORGANISM="Vaucheria litorea, Strain CCMP2940" /LENGTH=82 /DNA_ID=CAMNT_0012009465 /DNA_START=7 /DNA_END=255 /DNA_ORIENTATION=+